MARAQLVAGKDAGEDVLELSINEELLGEAMKEEEDDKVVEPPKKLTSIPCSVDSCPRTFHQTNQFDETLARYTCQDNHSFPLQETLAAEISAEPTGHTTNNKTGQVQ